MTHTERESNKEHMIRDLEQSVVSAMLQNVELTWKQADTVTSEDLERMTEKHDNKEAKKKVRGAANLAMLPIMTRGGSP